MSEQEFRKKLQRTMEGQFMQFDRFIIQKMGFHLEQDEQARTDAFHEFRKRTGREPIATMPTMRRWFGIGSFHIPTRENVIKMSFALSLEPEEAGEYLTRGLGEPYFQINDYLETLFLYGLEHHLSYDDCLKMAAVFEENMEEELVFSGTKSTKDLLVSFEQHKELGKEEFLLWMSDRADWFKGYSRTTWNYLTRFRSSIMEEIREEAKERLDELLKETEYERWRKRHPAKGGERDSIERFIGGSKRKKYRVSEYMEKCIRELVKLAYDQREPNTRMISEVFSTTERAIGEFRRFTMKYLSDLFHIPDKKEQAIRTAQALRVLDTLGDQDVCPDWIQKLGEEYTRDRGDFSNVEMARESLIHFQKEHRRRVLLISRSDLLPLILHVAQRQYERERGDFYDRGQAETYFRDLADATLNACNMETLSEEFRLDQALLLCFQEDEMYTYAELLDAMNWREETDE